MIPSLTLVSWTVPQNVPVPMDGSGVRLTISAFAIQQFQVSLFPVAPASYVPQQLTPISLVLMALSVLAITLFRSWLHKQEEAASVKAQKSSPTVNALDALLLIFLMERQMIRVDVLALKTMFGVLKVLLVCAINWSMDL